MIKRYVRKKEILFILSILMLLFLPPTVARAEGETAALSEALSGGWGNLTWTLDTDSGLLTISGTGEMQKPTNINTNPYNYYPWLIFRDQIVDVIIEDGVTALGNYAFYSCKHLKSITIPESVTSIGVQAFYFCSSLTDIVIPIGVTSIGHSAFYNCSSLTDIVVPAGVTSINGSMFYGCGSINRVSLPNGITSIGSNAFQDCSSLAGIELPNSLTSLGDSAFSGCSSLTDLTIPAGVTSIGYNAFYNCSCLTDIVIPAGVTSIRPGVFRGCTSLTAIAVEPGNLAYASDDGVLYDIGRTQLLQYPAGKTGHGYLIPDGVTEIAAYAFYNCSSLTSITVPNSVNSIGESAFFGCSGFTTAGPTGGGYDYEFGWTSGIPSFAFFGCNNLTAVTLPNEIRNIDEYAFQNCTSLTEISLPDGVTGIGSYAFSGCSNLESVMIPSSVTAIGASAFNACSSLTGVFIPSGVTEIGDHTFYKCSSLTEISLPNSVTSLGEYAFSGCSSLTAVTIPGSVESIGKYAFAQCSALTGAVILDGVSDIGALAFFGCSSLTNVRIPGSVTGMGTGVFSDCSSLTDAGPIESGCTIEFGWETEIPAYAFSGPNLTAVTLPNGINSIGQSAFSGCKSLTDITLPDSVASIGDNAFLGCTGLTEITIPGNVTEIASSTFYGCTGLESIILPDTITGIEEAAFQNCSSLKSIRLPDSLTWLDTHVFQNCSSLTEITIPSGLQHIQQYTFQNCRSLTSLTLPEGMTYIGWYAFSGCTSLERLAIPETLSQIGEYAFKDCSKLRNLTVPARTTKLGYGVFSGCSSLRSAGPIGSGCDYEFGWTTAIPDYAFCGCSGLTDIAIPQGITGVGQSAFSGCGSLMSITLPEGITDIGSYAFHYCSSLTGITIPLSVTTVGEGAFYRCVSLTGITVPPSVTNIGHNAFYGCTGLQDIFYDGPRETWEALAADAGLENVNVFAWDYDETLKVTITTQKVPGGIKVSMSSAAGMIYYTLNGTQPCAISIPYEAPFLLNEAGDYRIRALPVNRSNSTYGDTETNSFKLERSAVPELYEEDSAIHMDGPSGCIYYVYGLMTEPTTSSSRYTDPIPLKRTRTVRARVIENGKAPSELVTVTFCVSSTFRYPNDSYSFPNAAESFGYPNIYRIGEDRYQEIFGRTNGRFLYEIFKGKWNGSCFGMSATALMFSRGMLDLDDFGSTETVNALSAPRSRDSALTRIIERYQVAQFIPDVLKERNDVSSGGNMVISNLSNHGEGDRLLNAVRTACDGGEPIILILWRNELSGSHTVVPYRLENGKIYVYDSNRPNVQNILTYTKNDDGTYSFRYGEYGYAVSYNTLSLLMARLEGLRTEQVVLTADGKPQMLISLNTRDFRILDQNGKEVTDYITVRATEDMEQTATTVLSLDQGSYTILNTDSSLTEFALSASTENDYYTVEAANPTAQIQIGVEYGHLFVAVTCEDETEIAFHTSNATGRENDISVKASYAKVYACTDLATLIETTATSMPCNGETIDLTKEGDLYIGAVGQVIAGEAMDEYDDSAAVRLNTDIGELLDETFTLTANVTGAGDTAVIYAACYDASGQMTATSSWETEEGKTKYPFTIPGGTAEVKLYVLDKTTSEPLTAVLTLRQG
ncbi:MAG: leucine-rich repeat protein [Oscillospiraceae bacterium]|nr:leucine-rich repeat protein [Oscillospiraceae bacterium]